MTILCCITSRNDGILHITETLCNMGHRVHFFPTDSYRETCAYFQKKLDKFGFHSGRDSYIRNWRHKLRETVDASLPPVSLFINNPDAVMTPQELQTLRKSSTTICWFVDSVKGGQHGEYLSCYDRIFVFEKGDVDYIREQYHIEAEYCPVGYNSAYEKLEPPAEKDIDIVFVGSPFKNRLHILEELSTHVAEHQWNMRLYGPFYDERYFWKKQFFQNRYPGIARYLQNGAVEPAAVANLYARSKICLNIHLPEHKGVNPRTFEIMATGSFQLIDVREDYGGLDPEQDMVVFDTITELIEKIIYYLEHEDERERIAAHGRKSVMEHYSMGECLNRILSLCENEG